MKLPTLITWANDTDCPPIAAQTKANRSAHLIAATPAHRDYSEDSLSLHGAALCRRAAQPLRRPRTQPSLLPPSETSPQHRHLSPPAATREHPGLAACPQRHPYCRFE